MLNKIQLEHILFLDIETVPEKRSFDQLDDTTQQLWAHKSQYQRKEEFTAEEFKTLLNEHFNHPKNILCAHNGKEFDFPYIARRMIIHGISLPNKLDLFGKKPWEIPHIDTMELWKFGDYKHYTSLKLMAHVLGIPSPKEDIDGSMVKAVYYEENDLKRIVNYCELDVLTTAQVYLRLRNESLLEDDEIKKVAK